MVKRIVFAVAGIAAVAFIAGRVAIGSNDAYAQLIAPASRCADANHAAASTTRQIHAMICLIDFAREQSGERPLPVATKLTEAADIKASEIASCGAFSHTPCGTPFTRPFTKAGFGAHASVVQFGENLAWGVADAGAPRAMLSAWLNSPEHRENLLQADWRLQGLTMVRLPRFLGHSDVELWVSEFGWVDHPGLTVLHA